LIAQCVNNYRSHVQTTADWGRPEYTGWINESASWKASCYIGDWSFLDELRVQGLGALKLFSDFAVNSFAKFDISQAKHIICCNEDGKVIEVPMHLTQALRRAAQIRPRSVATKDGGIERTWSEVVDRVARFAGALRKLGFRNGDRAAVLSLNSGRYFETLYAVPWAGGAVVPINTRLAAPEIDYILADSGAKILLIDQALAPHLKSLEAVKNLRAVIQMDGGTNLTGLAHENLVAAATPAEDALRGGSDLAGIYYTGGTTGKPKGVMLTHGNLIANAMNVIICLGYDRDTVYLHAAPMFHLADGCSTFGVTMQAGTHVFTPRFDPVEFLDAVSRYRVTNVTLVPTMINMFLNHPRFAEFDLSSFKRIYFGAAPMPDGLLRQALTQMPLVKFQQAWGMTELSPIATTMDPRFYVTDESNAPRLRSCGQAVSLVEVRIVDANDAEVPRGTVGEIVVGGPTVMAGYWNQPETTAAVLRDGWMHSGDAGYMDDEGFVYIVDRLKDMIVTGGENVYSAEVENAISRMPSVSEVAVIGIPDDKWGEAVHAIVVPRQGHIVTVEEVLDHCKQCIAGFKCPRSVEIRPTPLPLSGAGKVLKTELREPYWQGRQTRVN
jgi:long-chain acyl-CoA synthetase